MQKQYFIAGALRGDKALRGIALHGDKEKLDQPGNPGNFLALLKLMSESDPLLHEHLNTGRVTYVSPQSQNEMIEVIGKQFIQAKRFEEIAEAKY